MFNNTEEYVPSTNWDEQSVPEESGYEEPGSGAGETGYGGGQGNFDDGYQENVHDQSNLLDTAYADSAAKTNPQSGYSSQLEY